MIDATRADRAGEAGFTLIELLISITILGFIMLALFGGLRFGARVWDRSERQMASASDISRVQALLRREIGGAYPAYVVDESNHGHVDFSGASDSISLLGPAPFSLAEAGRARLKFRTDSGEDGVALVMEASPELVAEESGADVQKEVLLTHLKRLAFSYFGQPEGSRSASWQEQWPVSSHLPTLIRIEAVFEGQGSYWPVLTIAPVLTADVSCRYDPLIRDCQGR